MSGLAVARKLLPASPLIVAFVCVALVWLSLGPYPWPVNPTPFPWPTNPYPWTFQWLPTALALVVVTLAASERGLAHRVRAWVERRALALVIAGMLLVLAYGGASALIRFLFFDADWSTTELRWMASLCWNTWDGRPFEWPLAGHYFAVHVSLVPVVLLPLCPPGIGLPGYLLGQSLLLVLPAWPVFLLARLHLAPFPSLLLSWAYLLLPGIFSQHIEGAQEAPLIALPLTLAILFYRRQRLRLFLIAITLGAAVVEYYAPVFALFGLWAWRDRRTAPWILVPLGLAALWPTVAYGIVLPAFRHSYAGQTPPGDPFWGFQCYEYLGASPAELIARVIGDPATLWPVFTDRSHLLQLYELLLPFLFVLPWGAPEALMGLGDIAINLPATCSYVVSINGGHAGLASTALLAGTAATLGRFRWKSDATSAALVRTLAAAVFVFAATSQTTMRLAIHPVLLLREPTQALRDALALVPPGEPVAAPLGVVPHLANRHEAYSLWYPRASERLSEGRLAAVLFRRPAFGGREPWETELLEKARRHPAYELVYEQDGVLLFLRKTTT